MGEAAGPSAEEMQDRLAAETSISHSGTEARDGDAEELRRRRGTPSNWTGSLQKLELERSQTVANMVANPGGPSSTPPPPNSVGVDSDSILRVRGDGDGGNCNAGNAKVQIQRKRIAPSRSAFFSSSFKFPDELSLGPATAAAAAAAAASTTPAPPIQPISDGQTQSQPSQSEPQSQSASSTPSASTRTPTYVSHLSYFDDPNFSSTSSLQNPGFTSPNITSTSTAAQASSSERDSEKDSDQMPAILKSDMIARRMDNAEVGAPCAFPRNAGDGFSIRLSHANGQEQKSPSSKSAGLTQTGQSQIETQPVASTSKAVHMERDEHSSHGSQTNTSLKRKHATMYEGTESVVEACSEKTPRRKLSRSSASGLTSPVSTRFESRGSLGTAATSVEQPEKRQRTGAAGKEREQPELRTPQYRLPLRLPRPENVQHFDDSELEFDGELAEVPVPYVLDNLRASGPDFLHAVSRCSVALPPTPSTSLPSYISAQCSIEFTPPDFALALTSDETPSALILPVHGLVMATTCKAFSLLIKKPARPKDSPPAVQMAPWQWCGKTATATLNLPVVHIHLPSANAFALLVPFLYTSSPTALISSLLPLRHQPGFSELAETPSAAVDVLLSDTPNILAARLSVIDQKILMQYVNLVHSVWQTAVALGAARDALWKTLDVTWSVLIGAIAMKEDRARSSA